MASPFEIRLQSILKNHVTPLLKNNGFTKTGSVYYCSHDVLDWLVEIERSGFNDVTQANFTIVCGVYVPRVMSRYITVDQPEPARPKYPDCTLYARLGWLAPEHLDVWWTLSSLDDNEHVDAEIGRDIIERLITHGLPFMQQFFDRKSVLNFLLESRMECEEQVEPRDPVVSLVYASIISFLLGDRQQGEAAIQAAEKLAIQHSSWSDFPEVKKKVLDTQTY